MDQSAGPPARGQHLSRCRPPRRRALAARRSDPPGDRDDGARSEAATARLFKALTSLDAEGRGTRRRRTFAELVDETGQGEELLGRVIDRLRAPDCSFLSVKPAGPLGPGSLVDIAHEALIRQWPRLGGGRGTRGWLHEEAEDADTFRTLRRFARTYAERPDALLSEQQTADFGGWRDRQARTETWAARYGGGLAEVDELLAASRAKVAADRDARAREETWRRRWRLAALIGIPTVAAILIIGLAAFLYRESTLRAEAASAAHEATSAARRGSMMLLARAEELAEGNNGRLASLLAMEALPERPEVTPDSSSCRARYRR